MSVAIYGSGSSLLGYRSGVYSGCPVNPQIDHGVLLVGYDSDWNWIVKNSWGRKWGNNGFGTISRNRNCGINMYADYIVFNNGTALYSIEWSSRDSDFEGCIIGLRKNREIFYQFGETPGSGPYMDYV